MISLPIAVTLGAASGLSYALAIYYSQLSLNELRKQSRRGDPKAAALFQVARHSVASPLLLKLVSLGVFLLLAVYVAGNTGFIKALVTLILVLCLFGLMKPYAGRIKPLAVLIAPYYLKLIIFLKPYSIPVKNLLSVVHKKGAFVYDKDDVIDMLAHYRHKSPANDQPEIDMAISAMKFNDKVVKNYLTPRKVVHFVDASQHISTAFINELHESGFSRFPVYAGSTDTIVGTLFLKDLVEKRTSGKVANAMSPEVHDIFETDTLQTALSKFLKTKHHLFIVHNEFHEVVGVITIEDVLEQLIGRRIVDESDVYDDMRDFASTSQKAS